MNNLEEKQIQWDLNLSVLIHYLTSRTVCVSHAKQLSRPLLGAARLSPWTLVLPGRYKTFSTNKDFQKSRHLLPPTTSFSPILSRTAHESPGWRHRWGEGLPLGVRDLRWGGLADTTYGVFMVDRNLRVESGRLLKPCIVLRWRRTDGPRHPFTQRAARSDPVLPGGCGAAVAFSLSSRGQNKPSAGLFIW